MCLSNKLFSMQQELKNKLLWLLLFWSALPFEGTEPKILQFLPQAKKSCLDDNTLTAIENFQGAICYTFVPQWYCCYLELISARKFSKSFFNFSEKTYFQCLARIRFSKFLQKDILPGSIFPDPKISSFYWN